MLYCEKIKNMILEINEFVEIEYDTPLIAEEILDSLSIIYLVTELENEYSVIIKEEDINPNNFYSVETISQLVNKLIR